MADLITTERSNITAIANAVRNKTGNSEQMTMGQIIDEINNIESNAINSDAVCVTPQTFTEEQKAQARENIGAASEEDVRHLSEEEVVKYIVQDLTEEQKAQARENIGAAGENIYLWSGKTLNFIGDSITEGYASTEKFVDIIASKLKATCNNYGIGGSTIADGQNSMYSRVLQMDEDADLCVVFGGTNDFANYDRAIGEQFIVSNGIRSLNMDTTTFYGGLNQLCTNLYNRFPYSTLILCTPLNRQNFAGQETDLQANGAGLYLDEYVEAIKKVAAYFSIPCLDLYATANLHPLNAANIAKYYSESDQLHPNAEGHKHLAKVMLAFFETLADKRGRNVIVKITATYTGGKVILGTALSDLTGIVVTAHYSDGSTESVNGYTLSGNIVKGNNTITVIYGGHTTTFVVTGDIPDGIVYSVFDTSRILEIKQDYLVTLQGELRLNPDYVSWKIPCSFGDIFMQYSTSGYGMYRGFYDENDNLITGHEALNGNPTSFSVPNNENIAYMWTCIRQEDIDDGSFMLINISRTIE